MHLTNAFLSGIAKNGEYHFEIINVIEKKIKPCMGCFACWKIQNGKCIQNDYQNEILAKITNEPTAESFTKLLLEKFIKAGEEYSENLKLSKETAAVLETPMLPNKIYVNGNAQKQ